MASASMNVTLTGGTVVEVAVIRSDRKSLLLELRSGQFRVRAPKRMSDARIRAFLDAKKDWIGSLYGKAETQRKQAGEPLTAAELEALKRRAREIIPLRVRYYAARLGVSYGTVTIRCQSSRWGSCTSKGNLNFNCLLLLAPMEVLDSVVIHELCHRKHMNHSAAFYQDVLAACPDYWKHTAWLKENGPALLLRAGK